MSPDRRLAGILGILLLGAGFLFALFDASVAKVRLGVPIPNGAWAKAYSDDFDADLPIREPARQLFGGMNYGLFGEAKSGVLVGSKGWLFTDEEMSAAKNVWPTITPKLRFIAAEARFARSRGVNTLVVLIPAKLRLYGKFGGRYHLQSNLSPVYAAAEQWLSKNDVRVVDLREALQAKVPQSATFLRTDTHWNPAGARIAAASVANLIFQSALLPRPSLIPKFRRVSEGKWLHRGDLMNFIPLASYVSYLAPAADGYEKARLEQVGGSGTLGSQLLSNATVPVVLVGTSYSHDQRWQFENFLKLELNSDLINASREGEGPYTPMKTYLSSKDFSAAPPKVIVWEIPERYLWTSNPQFSGGL